MSRIFNDGRLFDSEMSVRTEKRLDRRSYPKMYIPENESIDYLRGIEWALRFILSIDLQCVSLAAGEALDRVEEMQEAIIESMGWDI